MYKADLEKKRGKIMTIHRMTKIAQIRTLYVRLHMYCTLKKTFIACVHCLHMSLHMYLHMYYMCIYYMYV